MVSERDMPKYRDARELDEIYQIEEETPHDVSHFDLEPENKEILKETIIRRRDAVPRAEPEEIDPLELVTPQETQT